MNMVWFYLSLTELGHILCPYSVMIHYKLQHAATSFPSLILACLWKTPVLFFFVLEIPVSNIGCLELYNIS